MQAASKVGSHNRTAATAGRSVPRLIHYFSVYFLRLLSLFLSFLLSFFLFLFIILQPFGSELNVVYISDLSTDRCFCRIYFIMFLITMLLLVIISQPFDSKLSGVYFNSINQ